MNDSGKARLRKEAAAARRSQSDKDALSRLIIDQILCLSAYGDAGVVLWYVDVRDEVRTRHAIPNALSSDQTVVVPFCDGDELSLFRLESMNELAAGRFGILEPRNELRPLAEKSVSPRELDVLLVPGVAFDLGGGRLGHGKGFYDRLLSETMKTALRIGVAFDAQIVDQVPTDDHDEKMDFIATESGVRRC